MSWTNSAIFREAMKNPLTASASGTSNVTLPTGYSATGGIVSDTINVALFLTGVTPDKTAAVGSTGYNTGTWTTGNEAPGTGNYTQGGTAIGTTTYSLDTGSSSMIYHAGNTSWTSATISSVFGDLVYDNSISAGTVAKQGYCFNYFGGSQSVTAGTFTIQWATPGGAGATAVFNISV
jgi:hypothetical protein